MIKTKESLAVKYRPKELDQVIGQDSAVKILKGMFKDGVIRQSLLITGPSGTGKTSMARTIAHYVNCENFDTKNIKPCWTCSYCQKVLKGEYVNVEEINFSDSRGIDTVRSIIDSLNYEVIGNSKVFILDELQNMTSTAQNAFLKPLEEPPEDVVFILITTDPLKLLPQIKNRCETLRLDKVSESILSSMLKYISEKEGKAFPDYIYKQIALSSKGLVRQAVSSLESLIHAYSSDENFDFTNQEALENIIGKDIENEETTFGEFLIGGIYSGKYSRALASAKILTDPRQKGNPKSLFESILNYHLQSLYLMVDPKESNKCFNDEFYSTWKETIKAAARAKQGNVKLNHLSAAKITELLLELINKLGSFEFDTQQLVMVYTIKMIEAVNCYENSDSLFHKVIKPKEG